MRISNYYEGFLADNLCPLCDVTREETTELLPDECKNCDVADLIEEIGGAK